MYSSSRLHSGDLSNVEPQFIDSNSDLESNTDEDQDESVFNGIGDVDSFEIDNEMFEPVYENANITTSEAYCAIMEFKRSCHLPFTAIDKLLQLLQLLCPADNRLPQSVYYYVQENFQKVLIHLPKESILFLL